MKTFSGKKSDSEALSLIKGFEERLESIDRDLYGRDWWTYFGKIDPRLNGLREQRLAIYNDRENFEAINRLADNEAKNPKLPEKTRRILFRWNEELKRNILDTEELRQASLMLEQKEDKLKKIRGEFRIKLKDGSGEERPLSFEETQNLLRKETSQPARERVYKERAKLGDEMLEAGFRELIKERNEFARLFAKEHKFNNPDSYTYYSLKYRQLDFNEEEIFETFKTLKTKSDSLTKRLVDKLSSQFQIPEPKPWDLPYLIYRETKELDSFLKPGELNENVIRAVKSMGFTPTDYDFQFDLFPKEGKMDNALCYGIVPPKFVDGRYVSKGDIRLFANILDGGLKEQKTIFHEWGHLLHQAYVKQEFYLFRNLPDNPSLTEGVAGLFEHFPTEEEFYTDIMFEGGKDRLFDEKLKRGIENYRKIESETALLELRLILTRVFFEKRIYENPDTDFAKAWSEVMSEMLFVGRTDKIDGWIERPHFVSHPGYYQSYAVAALIKEQFYSFLKEKFGRLIGNPKVGRHLQEHCFAPGNSMGWKEIVKNTVGAEFSPEPFLKRISLI